MLYLSGVDGLAARALAVSHGIGFIAQPRSYGPRWCAAYPCHALDNGCFRSSWAETPWLRWLDRFPRDGCLFAVVPDVVGDAAATLERWDRYADRVAAMGFRRAFVLQNGQERHEVPPAEAVFIGGDTAWKLGEWAAWFTMHAAHRGQWVHMGRANSLRRLRRAAEMHCRSADGNFLAWAPDTNAQRLAYFLEHMPKEVQYALA